MTVKRVLVADDEGPIRTLIGFALRRRGYEVVEAAAGDLALEMIRSVSPDLVLLDIRMPGLTGIEVAEALRQDPRTVEIPFIMLSANGQQHEIAAGLAAGAAGYLVKPFAPGALVEMVAKALGEETP